MKHILLPTDFSEVNEHVLAYGVALAKISDAELTILYVKHPHLDPSSFEGVAAVSYPPDNIPDTNKLQIENVKKKLSQDSKLKFEVKIADGFLQDKVLEIAKQKKIDLILLGNDSAHKKNNIWFESKAADVITKRKYPVLVIPKTYTALPTENMEMVFATDFKEVNDWEILDIFRDLALTLNANITLFHVKDDNEGREWTLNENDLFESYEEYFDGLSIEVKHSNKEDIVSAVESFAKDKNAGLVVMVSHDLTFLERLFHTSITKEMSIYTEVPFLAIPDVHLIENVVGVDNSWSNL